MKKDDDNSKSLQETDAYIKAQAFKGQGNASFQEKKCAEAAQAYQSGLDCLEKDLGADGDNAIPTDDPLVIGLRSNLAMMLLKQDKFQQSEVECTRVLAIDPNNTKVLYRRAMAYEGPVIHDQQLEPSQIVDKLTKALNDVETALTILQKSKKLSPKIKIGKDTQIFERSIIRLKESIESAKKESSKVKPTETKINGTATATTSVSKKGATFPSDTKQKQDVMKLLISRQLAINKEGTKHGEAFFLIDWNWWCLWCRYTDFYHANGDAASQSQKKRVKKILHMLPPGAIVPLKPHPKKGSDSGTSDSDSDSEAEDISLPPGPIDNTKLLLPPDHVLVQHWYNAGSKKEVLRPNLVRGYDYEILPREVYFAFHTWYGEVTQHVCRRATKEGKIVLYPPPTSKVTTTKGNRCSACRALDAKCRCRSCTGTYYCDRACQEGHWPYHKAACKSGKGSVDPGEQAGRVGLNNLGNTCFMNSALQCLSHATPLTRYFLSSKFKADVNTANLLGTGGKLAFAYDLTMKDLWMKANSRSTSPTALKRAIALFAPRFAGCLQHDAQEFLAYLLDGLHEDLNRIRKAPYVEMPDVTDGHNMAIAGAEAWDAHKRRNDSLVMDTVYGQFKSTCICPKCQRVSVSFDAFNHVSLEIPQQHDMIITKSVLVFREFSKGQPLADKAPQRYGITLRKGSLIADLKRGLSEIMRVKSPELTLCGIGDGTIFEILDDRRPISQFRNNHTFAAYELDSSSDDKIYAITSHRIVSHGPVTSKVSKRMGFPLMISFDGDSTCKQVWDEVWAYVDYLVKDGKSAEGYVDEQASIKPEDILDIRVVTEKGEPVIFRDGDQSEDPADVSADQETSILPHNSSSKMIDLLGPDCTESYLFLSLDWHEPDRRVDPTPEQDDTKYPAIINIGRFVHFVTHPSFGESMQRQKAQNTNKTVTLDQCFQTFTKPERLDENNQWYCSKCKEHVRALKTMKLWRLPNVLVIHLKRFAFKNSFRREKLSTLVDFPLDGLDMTAHCGSWEESENGFVEPIVPSDYDLFAVVNHYGRMGFGHYTAFARKWDERSISDDWALFDDSNAKSVGNGQADVVSAAAYVLFYRRRHFH